MKMIRVALLVMALAIPIFADNIPNGVKTADEIPNGDAIAQTVTQVAVSLLNLILL